MRWDGLVTSSPSNPKVPILADRYPSFDQICHVNPATEDFPFVPVTATAILG